MLCTHLSSRRKLQPIYYLIRRSVSTFRGATFTETTEKAAQSFKEYAKQGPFSVLTPNEWDNEGKITKTYVPFWLFDIDVTLSYDVKLGKNMQNKNNRFESNGMIWSQSYGEAHFAANNISCYASTLFERSMVEEATSKYINQMNEAIIHTQLLKYESPDYKVDVYTIDKDSALFLTTYEKIKKMYREACLADAKQRFRGYDRYEVQPSRDRTTIKSETLLYYPLFVLKSEYQNVEYNSFLSGRDAHSSHVVGYRQISAGKTFVGTLAVSQATFTFFNSVQYGLFESITNSFPVALLLSGVVAYAASNYSKLKRVMENLNNKKVEREFVESTSTRDKEENNRRTFYDETHDGRTRSQQRQHEFQQAYYEDYNRKHHERYQQWSQQQQHQQDYQQQRTAQRTQQRQGEAFMKEAQNKTDFYSLIDLDPKLHKQYKDADIKKAYHQAALKNHPDMKPDNEKQRASEKFKNINLAYSILSDSTKRNMYHLYGKEGIR
ncbi:csp [Acrasis kona]|uniref:Csp n=1 Tax=Acrasis kona TaxID=1008807 RepID=A0AAW2ZLF1_9EUKA